MTRITVKDPRGGGGAATVALQRLRPTGQRRWGHGPGAGQGWTEWESSATIAASSPWRRTSAEAFARAEVGAETRQAGDLLHGPHRLLQLSTHGRGQVAQIPVVKKHRGLEGVLLGKADPCIALAAANPLSQRLVLHHGGVTQPRKGPIQASPIQGARLKTIEGDRHPMAAPQSNGCAPVEDESRRGQWSKLRPQPSLAGREDVEPRGERHGRVKERRGSGGTGPEGVTPSLRCQ